MDIGLFLKVIILQATTVLIWELGKALHEVYMFQVREAFFTTRLHGLLLTGLIINTSP